MAGRARAAKYPLTLSSLAQTGGTIRIDTGDGYGSPSMLYNGATYAGEVVIDGGTNVALALFDFSNVYLTNVTVSVIGNLGLVLASRGNMFLSDNMHLDGSGGSTAVNVPGGPGGEGLSLIHI